jgi:hypothetical protein
MCASIPTTQKSLISLTKTNFPYTGELNPHKAFKGLNAMLDTRQSNGNAVMSFVVNKVDYDPTNAVGDYGVHRQFTLGTYGCFVDSHRTRIMQLGIQNKSSPDIFSVNGIREEYIFAALRDA